MKKPEVRKSNVTVRWENPFVGECNVSRFTVYYRETMERRSVNWTKVIVSRDDFQTTLQLNCTTVYEIAVTAWSSHGETLRDGNIKNTQTFGGTLIPDRFRSTRFFLWPIESEWTSFCCHYKVLNINSSMQYAEIRPWSAWTHRGLRNGKSLTCLQTQECHRSQ